MSFKLHLSISLVLATMCSASAQGAELKAKPILKKELWLNFEYQGKKVGFHQGKDESTSLNGRPAVHLSRWSMVSVKRKESAIQMESRIDSWCSPSGAPLRFKRVNREGKEVRTGEGYRDGKQFIVETSVGGNKSTKKWPITKDTHLSLCLDALFLHDLRVGKELKGKAILEEDGQLTNFSLKVTGKQGELFVLESELARIKSRTLVGADGRTVEVEHVGLGFKLTATNREDALKLTAPFDIFQKATFAAPDEFPDSIKLDELVVQLGSHSGKRPIHIVDKRQRLLKSKKKLLRMKIQVDSAPLKPPRIPIKSKKMKPYLVETPYEPLKDEALVATARREIGKVKNAWEAAKRLNKFVYKHIETKSMARAFASANEALESKEGDCTEHAVLFSALAKIVGIPTKLATGLVLVGGDDRVFGYHEWVEVWMGSKAGWIAMDPTFGQDIADPTHIKFAEGQSDADGLREAGMVAASLIGDLELKVLEYTLDTGQKKRFP